MVKYKYDVERECFKRVDNRGKPLYVNITEANKIVLQLNLGYPVSQIEGKVALSNPQGTITTVRSFIKNYKQGNIEIPTDAPVPVRNFEEMSDSTRIDNLEERVKYLEDIVSSFKKENNESVFGKVKGWIS